MADHPEPHAEKRFQFTDKQRETLVHAYSNGMTSTTHSRVKTIAGELCLPEPLIKNWIGNYRRKVDGKPTKPIKLKTCIRTKLHYTSYNEFCKDKTMVPNDRGLTLQSWASTWANIPPAKKAEYAKKAKQVREGTVTVENEKDKDRLAKKLLGQVQTIFTQLEEIKYSGIGVIVKRKDFKDTFTFATNNATSFMKNTNIVHKFQDCITGEKIEEQKQEVSEVRLKVRKLFNNEYSKLVGKSAHMPYKAALDGSADFQVHLPSGVVFKDPSNYGLPTLSRILEEGIRLSKRSVPQTNIASQSLPEVVTEVLEGANALVHIENQPEPQELEDSQEDLVENIPDHFELHQVEQGTKEDVEEMQHDHIEVDQEPNGTQDPEQRKRSHSPDEPLQASKVNQSKRIHTDEKAFQCDKCDSSFVRLCHLQQHKLKHSGKNSFQCDHCTKLFHTASDLTKHEETHRAEKPVKCEPSKKTIYLLSYVEKAGDRSLQPVIPITDPHSPQPKQWTVIKGQCVPLKHQENMGASSTAVKLEITKHAGNKDASSIAVKQETKGDGSGKTVKQEISGDANSVDVKLKVNGDAGSEVLKKRNT